MIKPKLKHSSAIGVMAQVDTALAAEEKERLERMLSRELKSIGEEIQQQQQELQNMQKVIQLLTPQAASIKEINRRLISVKQKKEVKVGPGVL